MRDRRPRTPVCLQRYAEGVLEALPYGATRAADRIPRVLCAECQGANLGTYVFRQFCRAHTCSANNEEVE